MKIGPSAASAAGQVGAMDAASLVAAIASDPVALAALADAIGGKLAGGGLADHLVATAESVAARSRLTAPGRLLAAQVTLDPTPIYDPGYGYGGGMVRAAVTINTATTPVMAVVPPHIAPTLAPGMEVWVMPVNGNTTDLLIVSTRAVAQAPGLNVPSFLHWLAYPANLYDATSITSSTEVDLSAIRGTENAAHDSGPFGDQNLVISPMAKALLVLASYSGSAGVLYGGPKTGTLITGLEGAACKLHWRMDAASGTTQTDNSGTANNGTISGSGVAYSQAGISTDGNTALALTSPNGTISRSAGTLNPATVEGEFSVLACFKRGGRGALWSTYNGSGTPFGCYLRYGQCASSTEPNFAWGLFTNNLNGGGVGVMGSGHLLDSALPLTPLPTWIAVLFRTRYDAPNLRWVLDIFINGRRYGNGPVATFADATGTAQKPRLWDSSHSFWVGRNQAALASGDGGTNEHFTGTVDEVAVWNLALSDAEAALVTQYHRPYVVDSSLRHLLVPIDSASKITINGTAGNYTLDILGYAS